MTVISVQAGAAKELLDRQPEKVRTHTLKRSAAAPMMRSLSCVGSSACCGRTSPHTRPSQGSDIWESCSQNRATGLPIEFSQAGHQQALPAGLELAAYRIAQESLTNVRRHAGIAPTSVCIEYREDGFQLDITNAPGQRNGIIGPGSATN